MVSYYRPIVTLCEKCTVFRDMTYWLKTVEKTQTPLIWHHFLGVTPCEFFNESYLPRNYSHGAIRWCTFHDPSFALLGTIPACDGRTDRRTDGQTDRHVAIAKTRASIASRG